MTRVGLHVKFERRDEGEEEGEVELSNCRAVGGWLVSLEKGFEVVKKALVGF